MVIGHNWFVIAFLPRSKHLLILWLHSPSAVIGSERLEIFGAGTIPNEIVK